MCRLLADVGNGRRTINLISHLAAISSVSPHSFALFIISRRPVDTRVPVKFLSAGSNFGAVAAAGKAEGKVGQRLGRTASELYTYIFAPTSKWGPRKRIIVSAPSRLYRHLRPVLNLIFIASAAYIRGDAAV